MKKFFFISCAIASFFDAIAILLGFSVALRVKTAPGYLFSAVGALIVVAMMLRSHEIWKRKDQLHAIMRIFWILAIVLNVVMVLFAAANHILFAKSIGDVADFSVSAVPDSDPIQLVIVGALGIFLASSPIASSHLLSELENEDAEPAPSEIRDKVSA